MTHGDGDGTTYLPLVALDVAGHEMTHGVTSRSANLTPSRRIRRPERKPPDIMGTMVEFYANNANSPANYLRSASASGHTAALGVAQPTKALRYMFKLSLDGSSPDCYKPAPSAAWTCTTARAWPTTSTTRWPKAPVPSNFTSKVRKLAWSATATPRSRASPRCRLQDLVSRPDRVLYVQHQPCRCLHWHAPRPPPTCNGTGFDRVQRRGAAWSAVSVN